MEKLREVCSWEGVKKAHECACTVLSPYGFSDRQEENDRSRRSEVAGLKSRVTRIKPVCISTKPSYSANVVCE